MVDQDFVGRLVGNTGNPRDLTIALRSKNAARRGEFVRLLHEEREGEGDVEVLGRVKSISRSSVLFDEALGEGLAELELVYGRGSGERLFAKLELIGYKDRNEIRMPRAALEPGARIHKVDYQFLSRFYNFDENTSIKIGYLVGYESGPNAVPIFLDVNRIATEHMAVLAMTGAGKSFTVGRLVERLVSDMNASVVIFDPHGEYGKAFEGGMLRRSDSRGDQSQEQQDLDRIFARLQAKLQRGGGIHVYTPQDDSFNRKYAGSQTELALQLDNMDLDDLLDILPDLPDAQERVLDVAVRFWLENYTDRPRDVQDLLNLLSDVQSLSAKANVGGGQGFNQRSANIVRIKLQRLINNAKSVYTGARRVAPLDVYQMIGRRGQAAGQEDKVGRLAVIDLQGQSRAARQLTTAMICNEILAAASEPGVNALRPVFLVFEEGHNFAPAKEPSVARNIIRRIAQEGRKFGVGFAIVSQRPSRLDEDVTSQCNTIVAMRLKNPQDQQFISRTSDYFSAADLEELPGLSTGEALITGRAIVSPLLVKIGPKALVHGGETPRIIDLWNE